MFKEKPLLALVAILWLSLINSTITIAQEHTCGTEDHLAFQRLIFPHLDQSLQRARRFANQYASQPSLRSEQEIIIPVVVHIVHKNQNENLATSIVESQIEILNTIFSNPDAAKSDRWPQATSPNIRFILAQIDPAGNPTTGIIRKRTYRSFFTTKDEVKYRSKGGANAWPSDQYLNIWVCDLFGTYLGYAQYPGGGSAASDGIVVDWERFGVTSDGNQGKIACHEIGHWLGLRHIWGDGDCQQDDGIADTPSASGPSYHCDWDKATCGGLDMIENIMDYTNDKCLSLFTQGQKAIMRAQFAPGGARASLLTSPALPNQGEEDDCASCEEEAEEDPNSPEVEVEEPVTDPDDETPEQGSEGTEEETNPETDIPEETCPAPHNLSATFLNGSFIATWEGSSTDYIFQIQFSFSPKWYSVPLNRKHIQIAGLSANNFKARIQSVCNDDKSKWQDFSINPARMARPNSMVNTLLAYPNPASSEIQLHYPKDTYQLLGSGDQLHLAETKAIEYLMVYNPNHQLVKKERIQEQAHLLQVANLSPGLYFLVLCDQSGTPVFQTKIMVSR